MKKTVRTLGITAALAVMIPLSAYAATTSGSANADKTTSLAQEAKDGEWGHRGGFGQQRDIVSQEVLDLLKLDQAAVNEKIKAGSTLAQIAEEQGVTRDSLKSVLTEAFNKKQEKQKQEFASNLDKTIDSNLQASKQENGGGFRSKLNFEASATILGITADELKQGLSAGKSLSDLATEKGVDVQKLIDAQIAAITSNINQAVTDGKLTQEQANKQLTDVASIVEKIVNGKGFGHGDRHEGGGKDLNFGGKRSSGADAEATAESSASS
jgi:predicted transcriptional regulator